MKLMQLSQLIKAHDMEVTKLLQLNTAPFKGQKDCVSRLQQGMKTGVIIGTVQEDPGVKEAVKRANSRQEIETTVR